MRRIHILSLALVLASLMTSTATAIAASPYAPKGRVKRSAAKRRPATRRQSVQPAEVTYTCPMHHDVHAKSPGECPKCGMDLQEEKRGR